MEAGVGFNRLLVIVLMLVAALAALEGISGADGASIGVNYGRLGDNLPSPAQVVALLKSNNITKARIFDADPAVIQAFANSGIDLSVSIPNEQLQQIASSPAAAKAWLDASIAPFIPAVRFPAISIGNEVLTNNARYAPFLLPALQNVQSAIQSHTALRTAGTVVSTPHAFNVMDASSFPPSNGAFNATIALKPVVDFLSTSGSPFMINVYPFFSYAGDPTNVPLEYALFGSDPGVTDAPANLHYSNMYDAMVDTVTSALTKLGYPNMPVVVTETGWPSKGDEPGATTANAARYNQNLIRHVVSGVGTPARPGVTAETYIFALFNEDQKTGPVSERNFGLFEPSLAQVYTITLS
ncbi:glucan endo-1,3-beta-glucosidase 11 [Selaginella moellendorffii]|nr:glucan endo-1,3-beta-glucosidase 11 [Selaginella moellendorffii]|eukprot:XP_002983128.2 glucan endo-1,3-beta-glucosidase 11 [Selaginella moellendorffii]